MKIINKNNKIMKVKAVKDIEKTNRYQYKNNSFLIEIENQYYFVINRKFKNRT